MIKDIKKMEVKAWALAGIAPYFLEPKKTDVFDEALAMAREIKDLDAKTKVLIKIVLSGLDPQDVLAVVREIKDLGKRTRVLIKIALNLSDPLKTQILNEALATVKEINYSNERTVFLIRIAHNLPENQMICALNELIIAARRNENAIDRAKLIERLAPPNDKTNALSTLHPLARDPQHPCAAHP